MGLNLSSESERSSSPAALSCSLPRNVLDPTYIDPRVDSRSISFENPTGERGAGGKAKNGLKGRPSHIFAPGERVVLAGIVGPGTLRHIWMALEPWPPEVMRALRLEVFYDGMSEPSISVPVLDFFGLPHGRQAEYYSAMVSSNEGRGLNAYIPMPFSHSIRVEFTNESARHITLFYQIDYTLEPQIAESTSYLHATFRRENPTTLGRDFVIADSIQGPGRFLGCVVGLRVIDDGPWYGEGELKIYRDGDREFPTICGTGLEDYVGSAYGLGCHWGQYSGTPVLVPNIRAPSLNVVSGVWKNPTFVSFYRWHLPDPIMFLEDLRVTIQQLGISVFKHGEEEAFEVFKASHRVAGHGWRALAEHGAFAFGIAERTDDYCATSFVYSCRPQPVSRFVTADAISDIAVLPGESLLKGFLSDDEQDQENMKMKRLWGG